MLIPSLDHHGGSGLHNRHLIGVRLGVLVNFVLQAIWLDERHNAIALCPRTNGKSRPATANGHRGVQIMRCFVVRGQIRSILRPRSDRSPPRQQLGKRHYDGFRLLNRLASVCIGTA